MRGFYLGTHGNPGWERHGTQYPHCRNVNHQTKHKPGGSPACIVGKRKIPFCAYRYITIEANDRKKRPNLKHTHNFLEGESAQVRHCGPNLD